MQPFAQIQGSDEMKPLLLKINARLGCWLTRSIAPAWEQVRMEKFVAAEKEDHSQTANHTPKTLQGMTKMETWHPRSGGQAL